MFRTLAIYTVLTAGFMGFIAEAHANPRDCAEQLACCTGDACAEIMDSCVDASAEAADLADQLQALTRALRHLDNDPAFTCEGVGDGGYEIAEGKL